MMNYLEKINKIFFDRHKESFCYKKIKNRVNPIYQLLSKPIFLALISCSFISLSFYSFYLIMAGIIYGFSTLSVIDLFFISIPFLMILFFLIEDLLHTRYIKNKFRLNTLNFEYYKKEYTNIVQSFYDNCNSDEEQLEFSKELKKISNNRSLNNRVLHFFMSNESNIINHIKNKKEKKKLFLQNKSIMNNEKLIERKITYKEKTY